MTFAITGYKAYGVEGEEPISSKCYQQFLTLNITAANTDTDMDIGDYVAGALGTFWTAADDSDEGLAALKLIRQICARAASFQGVAGLSAYAQQAAAGAIAYYDSAAATGGAASEALTVTGLAAADTILSITPRVTSGFGVIAFNTQVLNGVTVVCQGNITASAVFRVAVLKAASGSPQAGGYTLSVANLAPNLAFVSGSAPTSIALTLSWELQTGVAPLYAVS